jgi:hypothetical protein
LQERRLDRDYSILLDALKEKQIKLLERKKLIEASKDAAEKRRTRKAENNRKYEFGGLVKAAGLFEWDKGQFLGALLSIKEAEQNDTTLARFKTKGDAFMAARESARKSQKEKSNQSSMHNHANEEAMACIPGDALTTVKE